MTHPVPSEPLEPIRGASEPAPALEDLEALEAAPAGLYGAPEAGRFRPLPTVTLGGQLLQTAPAGPADAQVVVDGLTFEWGRDAVTDQPDPATGRLQVFDLTGRWHLDQDLRGLPVVIRYTGTDPSNGAAISWVNFRGRVGSPVKVARRTVVHPVTGAKVTGNLVTLPLVSILVDLANRVPTVAWPLETLGARAARLQTEAAGVLLEVRTRDFWETPQVAPVAADQQVSILEHIERLYDSCGADRYTYSPHDQATWNLNRKHTFYSGMAYLSRRLSPGESYHPRADKGVFPQTYTLDVSTSGGVAGLAMMLDAQSLEYDPADGITTPDRITRCQLTHPDGTTTDYRSRSVIKLVTGQDEAVSGVRSAALSSDVAWLDWADLALADLENMVRYEGSRWRPGTLRLRTRRLDGFESYGQAYWLLAGHETNTFAFLQRSFLPDMGIRPIFGIMGGRITYEAGGWDLELDLSPVSTQYAQHPVAWEDIDDGTTGNEVQWWDGDHPKGMHESLTLEDLRYVSTGLGGTIHADYGWDEPQ